jgi:hypothetical protein
VSDSHNAAIGCAVIVVIIILLMAYCQYQWSTSTGGI